MEELILQKYGKERRDESKVFQDDLDTTELEEIEWPLDSANGKLSYSKMIYERNMRHFTRPKQQED